MSRGQILSAWIDSASWVHSMEYRLGHVPPSQPLVRGVFRLAVALRVSHTVHSTGSRARSMECRLETSLPSHPLMGRHSGLLVMCRACAQPASTSPAPFKPVRSINLLATALRPHPQERFLAGGVAGAVSRTVVAPLERLRTVGGPSYFAVSAASAAAATPGPGVQARPVRSEACAERERVSETALCPACLAHSTVAHSAPGLPFFSPADYDGGTCAGCMGYSCSARAPGMHGIDLRMLTC